jgi:CxxC motif-containing protein (DUF1111 family)
VSTDCSTQPQRPLASRGIRRLLCTATAAGALAGLPLVCAVAIKSPAVPPQVLAGGAVTVDNHGAKAYSQSAPSLDFIEEAHFKAGNMIFRGEVAGMGPLFNAKTCQSCHRQDGRGNVPDSPEQPMESMFLRLSVRDPSGQGTMPDPIYGDQLQTFGVDTDNATSGLPRQGGALAGDGAIGEGYAWIEYEPISGQYPDGTSYQLRRPVYKVRDLAYGDFAQGIMFSARVAPAVFGLGLLEAVPEPTVVAMADPEDTDGDGISGRVRYVKDVLAGEQRLGRMGYKAGQPTILQQGAGAFRGDIGVTNRVFAEEVCSPHQAACVERAGEKRKLENGLDILDVQLAQVEFYNRHLAVPRRRGWDPATGQWDPEVARGRDLFGEIGCDSCHVRELRTGQAPGSQLGSIGILELEPDAPPAKALSDQRIWPYTDLLLHDMGGNCAPVRRESVEGTACKAGGKCVWVQRCEGLADGRPEGSATGTEWRTAPLWGLGLVKVVNERANFLHDGRARTIEEAVLWHDGEAAAAKRRFMELERADREALLVFLESL